MYQENLFIIYTGKVATGKSLQKTVEPYGWDVKIAIEMMPALAMHVFYFPDIVIIDDVSKSGLAKYTCRHLLSIEAEPLLILADNADSGKWNIPFKPTVQILPCSANIDEIVDNASKLVKLTQELQIRYHQTFSKRRGLRQSLQSSSKGRRRFIE